MRPDAGRTGRTAAGARGLPGRYFTSREVFREERRRIFHRRWVCLGHASELPAPGDFLARELLGEGLLAVRDQEGRIRVFFNLCRHRGARLRQEPCGSLGERIRCPYHAWTYSLEGRLLGAPNMGEVTGFRRRDHSLREVASRLWQGLLMASLSESPTPAGEVFGPLEELVAPWRLPELVTAHRSEYEVAANWKLLFQNYSECYHCPTAHPALNRLTPYRESFNLLEEGPCLGGPMRLSEGAESITMSGRRCAPALVGGGDAGRQVHYYTLFPSCFLSLHPDYVLLHRLEPLATDRTRVLCHWLFHPEAVKTPGFDPADAVRFWDLTNRQDWELCARTQQGVSSRGYAPGPYSELESQLAAFDREYLRSLEADAGDGALADC